MKDLFEIYDLENEHEVITDIQPKGYDVSSLFVSIDKMKQYPDKTQITTYGYIDSFEVIAMGAKLKKIKARAYKDGESVILNWITSNQKAKLFLYSLEKNAPKDTLLQITGKITSFTNGEGFRIVMMEGAKIEAIGGTLDSKNKAAVIMPEPQYVLSQSITEVDGKKVTKKATPFLIKKVMRNIINNLDELREENEKLFLPIEIEKELELQDLKKSLRFTHGFTPIPSNKFDDFILYNGFTKRINIEKIWKILLRSYLSETADNRPSMTYGKDDIEVIKESLSKLPFELTEDQKKTIDGLLKVFSSKTGSKSLVYGDVGSGKTLVALITAYVMFVQGYQVAIITPTSILSRQHFEEAVELFGEESVMLLHSKTKKSEKNKINKKLKNGKPLIVIGTTSVNSLEFTKLKAVYIDEEQKIGVHAKERLHNEYNKEPHIIYMTATPIPRTLASSIFTDFSVFQIKAKPKNRKERITRMFDFKDMFEVEAIRDRIKQQQQSLVIVPSIDSNDMVNVRDTVKKYQKMFPSATIESINGRMKKDEVDEIISRYMDGDFDILIATVMVDSGFSNKRIAHVFIEGADRFGISQLHQIRGRCGRGELQGYCYLIPSKAEIKNLTKQRLKYLTESEDGFKLSEKDIELRGSGDLDGLKQTGTEVNFIDWIPEIDIMRKYLKENY